MLHIRYGINAVNHKSNLQSILYIPCEYKINIVWHVNYFMETSIKYFDNCLKKKKVIIKLLEK